MGPGPRACQEAMPPPCAMRLLHARLCRGFQIWPAISDRISFLSKGESKVLRGGEA